MAASEPVVELTRYEPYRLGNSDNADYRKLSAHGELCCSLGSGTSPNQLQAAYIAARREEPLADLATSGCQTFSSRLAQTVVRCR